MVIQKIILDVDKFIYVLITVVATLRLRMLITRQFIKTHYLFDEATGVHYVTRTELKGNITSQVFFVSAMCSTGCASNHFLISYFR